MSGGDANSLGYKVQILTLAIRNHKFLASYDIGNDVAVSLKGECPVVEKWQQILVGYRTKQLHIISLWVNPEEVCE